MKNYKTKQSKTQSQPQKQGGTKRYPEYRGQGDEDELKPNGQLE